MDNFGPIDLTESDSEEGDGEIFSQQFADEFSDTRKPKTEIDVIDQSARRKSTSGFLEPVAGDTRRLDAVVNAATTPVMDVQTIDTTTDNNNGSQNNLSKTGETKKFPSEDMDPKRKKALLEHPIFRDVDVQKCLRDIIENVMATRPGQPFCCAVCAEERKYWSPNRVDENELFLHVICEHVTSSVTDEFKWKLMDLFRRCFQKSRMARAVKRPANYAELASAGKRARRAVTDGSEQKYKIVSHGTPTGRRFIKKVSGKRSMRRIRTPYGDLTARCREACRRHLDEQGHLKCLTCHSSIKVICGKNRFNLSSAISHVLAHESLRLFKCGTCGYRSTYATSAITHARKNHGAKENVSLYKFNATTEQTEKAFQAFQKHFCSNGAYTRAEEQTSKKALLKHPIFRDVDVQKCLRDIIENVKTARPTQPFCCTICAEERKYWSPKRVDEKELFLHVIREHVTSSVNDEFKWKLMDLFRRCFQKIRVVRAVKRPANYTELASAGKLCHRPVTASEKQNSYTQFLGEIKTLCRKLVGENYTHLKCKECKSKIRVRNGHTSMECRSLTAHILSHLNLKPFKCKGCKHETVWLNDMVRHKRRQKHSFRIDVFSKKDLRDGINFFEKNFEKETDGSEQKYKIASHGTPTGRRSTKMVIAVQKVSGKRSMRRIHTPYGDLTARCRDACRRHVDEQGRLKCLTCHSPLKQINIKAVISHVLTHESLKLFKCSICKYHSTYAQLVITHARKEHGAKERTGLCNFDSTTQQTEKAFQAFQKHFCNGGKDATNIRAEKETRRRPKKRVFAQTWTFKQSISGKDNPDGNTGTSRVNPLDRFKCPHCVYSDSNMAYVKAHQRLANH